jgi:hypothetical protein
MEMSLMNRTHRAWNPNQSWLQPPPSQQDSMPEDDLVYFLMDVVRQPDISVMSGVYEKSDRGLPPFHLRIMVWMVCMSVDLQLCHGGAFVLTDCPALSAGFGLADHGGADIPDLCTISGFLRTRFSAFSDLFTEVL